MKITIIPLNEATEAFQRSHIQAVRAEFNGDMLATALALKVSLAALYARMKRLGLPLKQSKSQRRKDGAK